MTHDATCCNMWRSQAPFALDAGARGHSLLHRQLISFVYDDEATELGEGAGADAPLKMT